MSELKHIMLDLETLGTRVGSVIASIGAVKFDPFSVVQTAEHHLKNSVKLQISLEGSIGNGFQVDGSTLSWWFKQSKEAQKSTFEAGSGEVILEPIDALLKFEEFFQGVDYVWGNGANFDPPLLEAYLETYEIPVPWKYHRVMCFRTLKNTLSYDASKVPVGPMIKHDCVHDAVWQAQILQAICNQWGITNFNANRQQRLYLA